MGRGIMREPGKRAALARVSTGRRANSGRNRNRPPHWVRKRRGAREKVRTSATASTVDGALRSLLIQAAGQPGEALSPEDLAYGGGLKRRFSALSVSLIS